MSQYAVKGTAAMDAPVAADLTDVDVSTLKPVVACCCFISSLFCKYPECLGCKSEAKAYYLALLKHFRTNRINYRYTVSNNSFLKSFKSNYLRQLQGVHDWTKSAGYARELIISLSHASLHVQVTCARQQLCTERVIENACSQTPSDLHDTAGEQ